jgi:hypothetical protein
MIFIDIQYLKYSNGQNTIFEWHTWMSMFNTQNHMVLSKITSW